MPTGSKVLLFLSRGRKTIHDRSLPDAKVSNHNDFSDRTGRRWSDSQRLSQPSTKGREQRNKIDKRGSTACGTALYADCRGTYTSSFWPDPSVGRRVGRAIISPGARLSDNCRRDGWGELGPTSKRAQYASDGNC